METKQAAPAGISRWAGMLAAMGNPSRLRITQLLLTAHPEGMVVGEIQEELGMTPSNLSHHLEKLRHEGVVNVKREGVYLRCTADTAALEELLAFLYAECCSRSQAVNPERILPAGEGEKHGHGKHPECC
jgi:DNA-binding transcriptional ArsR family regulator